MSFNVDFVYHLSFDALKNSVAAPMPLIRHSPCLEQNSTCAINGTCSKNCTCDYHSF